MPICVFFFFFSLFYECNFRFILFVYSILIHLIYLINKKRTKKIHAVVITTACIVIRVLHTNNFFVYSSKVLFTS